MPETIKLPWTGWEVVKKLGGGSFGSVYEIRRDVLGTPESAAVKIIHVPTDPSEYNSMVESGYDKKSISDRFFADLGEIAQEYKLMAKLKGNANVIICDDIQYEENPDGVGYLLYIRMELLRPMTEAVTFPPRDIQVIQLGTNLCNALSACRKHNIIHRDIKPANILADADGRFKLGDFGVSKTADRTAGGTKTGTYGFMAPEVYNNRPYNHQVDIYSLGMVLYWMLNRRVGPFLPLPPVMPTARQMDEAKQRRFAGEALPPPADGSEALKAVVLKACAFDPAERYATPEAFASALVKCIAAAAPQQASVRQPAAQPEIQSEPSLSERTMGNSWDSTTAGTVGAAAGMYAGATVGAEPKPQKPAASPKPAPVSVPVPAPVQPAAASCSEPTMGNSWGDDADQTVGTVGAAYAGKTVGAPGMKKPKAAVSKPQEIDWTAGERTVHRVQNTDKVTPQNGIWKDAGAEKVYVSLEKAISGGISRLDSGKEIQIPPHSESRTTIDGYEIHLYSLPDSRPFSQQTLSRVSDQGLRQLYRAVERRLFDAGPLAKVVAVVTGLCLLIWWSAADVFKMINLKKTGSAIADGVFAVLCLVLLIFLLWKRPGFFDDVDLLNRFHRWKRRQELEPEMIRRNLLHRPTPVSMPKLFASFALTVLFATVCVWTSVNYGEMPRKSKGAFFMIMLGAFVTALVCFIWLIVNICKLISVKRMEAKFKKYGSGKRY